MAGTRTAPTVDGTGFTYKRVSLHWIDYTGEKRSDSYKFAVTATAAQIEAFAAAAQAISNASLWQISVSEVYSSVEDSQNASEEVWEEVSANLVFQTKDASGNSLRAFVPAPSNSVFLETTESIDPTAAGLIAYLSALTPLLPAGYSVVGARFTSRRDINQQIKI